MTVSDENEIDNVPSKEEITEVTPEELEELANSAVVYEDADADDDYPDEAEIDFDDLEETEETEVTPDNWEDFLPPVAETPALAPPGIEGFETLSASPPPFLSPEAAATAAGVLVDTGDPAAGEKVSEGGIILPGQATINQIVGANGLLNAAGQQLWTEPEPAPQEGFEP